MPCAYTGLAETAAKVSPLKGHKVMSQDTLEVPVADTSALSLQPGFAAQQKEPEDE